TGSHPISVAVVDINGDGNRDLVVANYGSNSVSVLLNRTAPGTTTLTFTTQQTFATGSLLPRSVAAADVNGDGNPDLVVANYANGDGKAQLIVANSGSNSVSVLSNFTVPGATAPAFFQQTFATGSVPVAVVAADINGDGLPDLLVANKSGYSVSVLLNTTTPG